MRMIDERPVEALDRVQSGHWEGDLTMGPGNWSAIGTLVERTTRIAILLHLPGGSGPRTRSITRSPPRWCRCRAACSEP